MVRTTRERKRTDVAASQHHKRVVSKCRVLDGIDTMTLGTGDSAGASLTAVVFVETRSSRAGLALGDVKRGPEPNTLATVRQTIKVRAPIQANRVGFEKTSRHFSARCPATIIKAATTIEYPTRSAITSPSASA